ncbi:carbohydrate-binding protein CenC, partial [Streptomyces mangrovi]
MERRTRTDTTGGGRGAAPGARRTSRARTRIVAALGAGAVAVGAVAFGGLSGSAGAAEPNLVQNGGFESGLSGWTCSAGSGTAVSSPVHGGTAALKA